MPLSYAEYKLQNGYLNNWLVAGPQISRIDPPAEAQHTEALQEIARLHYETNSGVKKAPVEQGPLTEGILKIGQFESAWKYMACGEDHFVHISYQTAQWQYARAWSYAQIYLADAREMSATVTGFGPIDVFLNKALVYSHNEFSTQRPAETHFRLTMRKGKNELIVRFANVAVGDVPLAMSMQLHGRLEDILVRIPSLTKSIARRNELERVNQYAYAQRDVYGARQMMSMSWPEDMPESTYTTVRIQTPAKRIYGETEADGKPGETLSYLNASQLVDGRYHFYLMPRPWEFYESDIRMTRSIEVMVVANNIYSQTMYGDLGSRRAECLSYAAHFENNLFGSISRMATGHWEQSDTQFVLAEIERLKSQDRLDYLALAVLLGFQIRYAERADFPGTLAKSIEETVVKFNIAKNINDAQEDSTEHESRRILAYTSAILAGQIFQDTTFVGGLTGIQLRESAVEKALGWMQKRGSYGFANWDSSAAYAQIITVLSLLIDLAEDEPVWEMASVLLDKMLFILSAAGFQGSLATARRSVSAWAARSSLMDETSGIARLMWGMGVFNPHLAGPVSLALMEKYELPPIFAQIASHPEPVWSRSSQSAGEDAVNKVAYRTKDYLLSSAQDYHPRLNGHKEQVWLAALGPNAHVFTNHPAFSIDQEGLAPGYWVGNCALPRVAQWKDALLALYRLPDNDRLGFTHAYFPIANLDEYVLLNGWAFARLGNAYLALTASQPIELVRHGITAFRELRAAGTEVTWFCQMGTADDDAGFDQFQKKTLALAIRFEGQTVSAQTLRGDQLDFGWDQAFAVNGQPQSLSGFPHFENQFCTAPLPSEEMEIQTSDYALRWNFRNSIEPAGDD